MRRCLGQWQAYVEQGASQSMRRARLDEVPAELREAVRGHIKTVWAIKARKRRGKT